MPPSTPHSSGKIIIKPPRGTQGRGRPRGRGTTIRIPARVDPTQDMEDNESVGVEEREGSSSLDLTQPSTSQAATPMVIDDDDNDGGEPDERANVGEGDNQDVDVEGDEGDTRSDAQEDGVDVGTPKEGAENEGLETPQRVRRGRGRPRGSGTSIRGTRGRPRGRGRGRGRPRGSTKKRGEDGEEYEEGEDGGPVQRIAKIQGKVYVIEGDEYVTEGNPKGDEKIDPNGNLLGGRKFKSQTFTLPNRHPERQYMLAIDAARTSGFRDSLYYFRRNLLALKLNATQWEKDHLIEAGKLGSHLRTRNVTLITARSAYKLHGAKMLVDGRWVVDDYDEERVLAEITEKGLKAGDLVGDLQDVSAVAAEAAALANDASTSKQDRGGGGGGAGTGMYRAGGPTTIFGGSGWGPFSDGPLNAVKKSYYSREGMNEENWMFEAAKRAVEMGEEWARLRKEAVKACGGILEGQEHLDVIPIDRATVDVEGDEEESAEEIVSEEVTSGKRKWKGEAKLPFGVYEPQTGVVLYRTDTQPTTSRWEVVPDIGIKRGVLGGTRAGGGAWGLAFVDTVMERSSPLPEHIYLQAVKDAEASVEFWS